MYYAFILYGEHYASCIMFLLVTKTTCALRTSAKIKWFGEINSSDAWVFGITKTEVSKCMVWGPKSQWEACTHIELRVLINSEFVLTENEIKEHKSTNIHILLYGSLKLFVGKIKSPL